LPGGVDVPALAEHEVHRHVEHVVDIALVAEAVLEHERQHSGAVRVGVGPDVAAVGKEPVGLALGERRIGEQRGGQRLQREAGAALLPQVRVARIIEVGLDRAGPQHHVEPERADPGHVPQHDFVAALGHDRQLVAALVRPHPETEEADTELLADRLDLLEMAPGLGAGLVEVLARRARELELAGGLEADCPVLAAERYDLSAFLDGLPAELLQFQENITDTAGLVVGGSGVVGVPVDEFLVLGADAPVLARLLAGLHRRHELLASLDRPFFAFGRLAGAHGSAVRGWAAMAPAQFAFVRGYQSPAMAIHAAVAAMAAVSPRRMRGPSEIGRACGSARTAARSASSKPPSGPTSSAAGPGLAAKAAAAGSPPSSSAKNSMRSAGQPRSSASSFTGSASSGSAVRTHCS